MSDFEDIQIFVRVAELGNLSAAGRELRHSAAVVSNRIARLEERLGVRLLNRTTRRVSLTTEGDVYYRHCLRILAEMQEAENAIANQKNTTRGPVTLTCPVAFGNKYVAPIIPKFVKKNPDVQIRLHLSDRLLDLLQDKVDLAIRIAELKESSLIVRKLAANKRMLVASPAYLKRQGTPKAPGDLLHHNCLLLRFPGSQQYQWTLNGAKEEGAVTLSVSGSMDSDNGEVLTRWCLDGHGIALKSHWEVGEYVRNGQLQVVLPDYTPPSHAVYALYPENRYLPTRMRAFVDFLVSEFGGTPPWDKV
ncbi:LysR family transcriptional regulator [Thalassospira alkalitolerans]|uniref:LysR family transcriptional regulator n=2 Tax=Thalassospira alkalitolerans TaxID=1293890 RepID=A0A1Y2LDU7_9PROT|nr:LysR family transcriptional regulator [Thalassospira alkalitolerans]OSQ49090.1 LysR family transcriptional regulator [Thalassospira alkalitolerans]|tara:strand:+ start:116185 stop:117099 length:915 start_codon:yes stop_codon:yes gene_type:complete